MLKKTRKLEKCIEHRNTTLFDKFTMSSMTLKTVISSLSLWQFYTWISQLGNIAWVMLLDKQQPLVTEIQMFELNGKKLT